MRLRPAGGDGAPGWLRKLGTFPRWPDGRGSPAWLHHVEAHGLPPELERSFPVHPTQLYESAAGLAILGLCLWAVRRRCFHGEVPLVGTIAYGVARAALELLRGDPRRGSALGWNPSVAISLALVPLGVGLYVFLHRRARQASPPRDQ